MRFAVGVQLEEADGAVLLAERRTADVDARCRAVRAGSCRRRSGRAARPTAARPSRMTSTPTVPPADAGSMRETWPLTTPLRVSTSAVWPTRMSLVWVSAIRSSAFRFVGSATRARLVPGATCCTALDRNQLEHAVHARLDLQVVELPHAQLVGGALLIDVRFLRRELRLDAGRLHLETFLPDLQPVLRVPRRALRDCFS